MGDAVRDVRFLRGSAKSIAWGYDSTEVDDLMGRVAAELDDGRPAGPLIENARFRIRMGQSYNIDAVDWFLNRLLRCPDDLKADRMRGDPWGDLAVAQFTLGGHEGRSARLPERLAPQEIAAECAEAWSGFDELPGVQLRWGRVGAGRWELRTATQTIAAVQRSGRSETLAAGNRSYAFTSMAADGLTSPDVADLAARSSADYIGHYASNVPRPRFGRITWLLFAPSASAASRRNSSPTQPVGALVDDAGVPVWYWSGMNYMSRATARISFPDQRSLRFPVRGSQANAVMTAVDQAGHSVIRIRVPPGKESKQWKEPVEITVHPDRELTDELSLAIAASARWV